MTLRELMNQHEDYITMTIPRNKVIAPLKGIVVCDLDGPPPVWADFASLVEKTTYKPGYQLKLYIYETEAWIPDYAALELGCKVADSYHFPHEERDLVFRMMVPAEMIAEWGEERLRMWLQEFFAQFELHERDEWFKVDGVMVNDPHA